MAGFPGHFLAQPDEPLSDPGNRSFLGAARRVLMDIEAASQVENALRRRSDFCREDDDWHEEI
jgi:hypothetical protein